MAITTSEKLWVFERILDSYVLELPLHIQAQKSISVEQKKYFAKAWIPLPSHFSNKEPGRRQKTLSIKLGNWRLLQN